jgi:NAD(P)-dependent dehydrogenase (short-subunit alcohol dehydrogenase family)
LSNFVQPSASLRTVIVTGGNSGLGYACAHSLLENASGAPPSHIILACRNPVRSETAVASLRDQARRIGSFAQVEAMRLDLASLQSVRDFVDEIGRRLDAGNLPPLYALVCNAGVQSGGKLTFTADGFESTFGVNHLAHFLLVNLLLPRFTSPARIVVVASGTHDPALKTGVPAPAWNDPVALARGELGPLAVNDSPRNRGQRSYSTSKLANVLFSYELACRLPSGITVNAFDPGLMPGTGLVRDGSVPLRFLWHQILPRILPLLRRAISPNIHTPAESGAALARLALDSSLEGVSGKYFEGIREIPSSTESYDAVRAKELWQASLALTGLKAELPILMGAEANRR